MANKTLLVEIGTEELPPKSLNRLRTAFAESVIEELNNAQLRFSEVKSFATPRRLALQIVGLSSHQPDQEIEKRGPAKQAAFDDEDQPTKALRGFMKGCGIDDPENLETLETDKGVYMVYRATRDGESTQDLLPGILQRALGSLPIDRRMRWGKSREEFVRPVQWLVCLHGKEVLPVELLGQVASNVSRGHRFMGQQAFVISDAESYERLCLDEFVVVDYDQRRETIRQQITTMASELNASLALDESLLDEVTALVEWPVALSGSFDAAFLSVPPEVLISAMKEHQRYFHLLDANGNLLPRFITVANLKPSDPAVVVAGNERVIRPRLSDAAFFFEQDTKTSLAAKSTQLANVVFQSELGSYLDKSNRIAKLASHIAESLGLDAANAARAGLLCKADLVSDMVGEFPDLQGIMGGYYASHDHEHDEVVEAIKQHYRPTQSGSLLPASGLASCVALADKVDSLVGIFGINQQPTGSRDPFALRRQSLGVIRIIVENHLDLSLGDMLKQAAANYSRDFSTTEVASYIVERLNHYYSEQGISGDVVEAATAHLSENFTLMAVDDVVKTLQTFKRSASAEGIVAANKRVANLLRKVDLDSLPAQTDVTLCSEPAEQALVDIIKTIDLIDAKSAGARLERLAILQAPIDRFFDEVLVMADDAAVKTNRLALLRDLRNLYLQVADFSLLQ